MGVVEGETASALPAARNAVGSSLPLLVLLLPFLLIVYRILRELGVKSLLEERLVLLMNMLVLVDEDLVYQQNERVAGQNQNVGQWKGGERLGNVVVHYLL